MSTSNTSKNTSKNRAQQNPGQAKGVRYQEYCREMKKLIRVKK